MSGINLTPIADFSKVEQAKGSGCCISRDSNGNKIRQPGNTPVLQFSSDQISGKVAPSFGGPIPPQAPGQGNPLDRPLPFQNGDNGLFGPINPPDGRFQTGLDGKCPPPPRPDGERPEGPEKGGKGDIKEILLMLVQLLKELTGGNETDKAKAEEQTATIA